MSQNILINIVISLIFSATAVCFQLYQNSNSDLKGPKMAPQSGRLSVNDPNSFSNPEEARVEHMELKWNLDFTRQVITGSIDYDVVVGTPEAKSLILDTNSLAIKSVTSSSGSPLPFNLGKEVLSFGQPLTIDISSVTANNQKIRVQVIYETASEGKCHALQWLDKEQTGGKKQPYVFSQCEPIHCRSLLPCQDTPSNKASYSAEVTVPKGLQALMSAVISNETGDIEGDLKKYKFVQKIPIPSYLIAIAAGNIVGKRVGPRVTIWTEPEFLEASAYEFMETEDNLKAAEKVLGEYVWGVYDVLVLPPSFAFGGMENPCLTFATPTLLAGDRSLVSVIYHEIAHSWTGNLVTNKNFEHFWLNEGFTVFGERKILSSIKGEKFRQLASISGLKDLADTIETMKPDNQLTNLVPNLTLIDPDDSFSKVPYEKGYTFLYYLEEKVGGGEVFEPFFREYILMNRFKSIDTDKFKSDFITYFTNLGKASQIEDIDWNAWLYTPGMPLVIPKYDTTLSDACVTLANQWVKWNVKDAVPFKKQDFQDLIPPQREEFLNLLVAQTPVLSVEKLKVMESVYDLNSVKNSEVRFRWLRLGIRAKWIDQVGPALQFVTEQGRMKFVRPIYRELYNWEEVRQQAIDHFKKTRKGMMHVCSTLVAKDLHLSS